MILQIFQTGIPTIENSDHFYEKSRNRRWIHAQNSWRFEPVVSKAAVKNAPSIYFETIISVKKERAIVRVGLHFGPLNGSGYTYILKKKNQRWKVTALVPTWIS